MRWTRTGALVGGALAVACGFAGRPAAAAARHVQVSLVSATDSIEPGQPLVVALRLQMDEGWHTYWKNPGDAGLPTRIAWRLTAGLEPGPLEWPRPERVSPPPVVSYGYHGEVLLPIEIAVPRTLAPRGTVELAGSVNWLECREACFPGKAEVTLTLPVRAQAPGPGAAAAAVAAARRSLPTASGAWKLEAHGASGAVALSFREPNTGAPVREAYFFPGDPQVIDYAAPQRLTRAGDRQRLELQRDPNGEKPLARLRGVLVAETAQGRTALDVDVPVNVREEEKR